MKTRTLQRRFSVFAFGLIIHGSASAATLVWSEDFGVLADGTTITNGNSNFSATVPSSGSLTAITSTVSEGSSLRLTGATSGTPAGAFGAVNGLASMTVMSVAFTVRFDELNSGRFGFYAGSGNTVINLGNTNLNPDHMLWDLSVDGATGQLQYRAVGGPSDGYYNVGSVVLSEGVDYDFWIQVNGTNETVDGLSANSMSLYLNGTLVGSDLAIRKGTTTATGFRVGGRGSSAAGDLVAEIDDIRVWSGVESIPEPSSVMLLAAAGGFLWLRRR